MSNLPKESAPEKPRKRHGCLKGLLILVVLIIVLLAGVMLTLSMITKKVANDQLDKQLLPEADLGKVNIRLLAGKLGIGDFHIAQPEGYEEGNLIELDELKVSLPLAKAAGMDPVEVRSVQLDGLRVNLISDTNEVMNVTRMIPVPEEEPEITPETETEETAEPAEPLPLWVQEVILKNIDFQFQDLAKEWGIKVEDLNLELRNFQMAYDSGEGPATLNADLTLPEGREVAKIKIIAKVGQIDPANTEKLPPLQLAVGIIGFDLGLIDPYLVPTPKVAKTAFGGSAFDFLLFFDLSTGESKTEQQIRGEFEITTNKGYKIDDKLSGTLAEPILPFTTLFADILGNQFGRLTKLSGNVLKGGVEAGKAVAETGVAAVKGAGKTVTGFAGGVLRTAKGVVTLDGEDALGGMKDATIGTVSDAAGTVTDTVGTAAEGLGDTAGAVSGSTKSDKWFAEIDLRMEAFDQMATAWFEANPFPSAPAPQETEKPEAEDEESEEDDDDD